MDAVIAYLKGRSSAALYGLAAMMFLSAWLLRQWALPPGGSLPYLTLYPAAIGAFLVCGTGAGAAVVAASVLATSYVAMAGNAGYLPDREGISSAVIFAASCAIIGHIVARLRRADIRLRDSEQRYRDVVQAQTESILRYGADGTILFVNDALCRLFQVPRELLVGHRWQPMRHPQDVHQVEQQLQQLCPESPDVTLEMRIVSSNGTVRWGQFAFRAFFNAHGALTETQAVGRDITEHKALQAQLAGAAQEIADLYENAPTGYHSLDARGVFQRANKIELAWLGCSRAELIGRLAITDFLDDEGKALFRSSFPTLIAHGQIEGLEFALIGRDGRRRDVRVNASAVRDAEGNFVMSRSVMFDVTDMKRTEQALQAANAQQRAILDSDLLGIARIRDRTIVWASPAMERLFGYESGRMRGTPTLRIFQDLEHYRQKGEGAYATIRAGGTYRAELPMLRKNGELFWAQVNGSGLSTPPDETLWLFSDISRRKEAELQLRASDESLRVTLDSIGEAVITTDQHANVVWLNRVAEKLTGWRKEAAIGRPLTEVFVIVDEDTHRPKRDPVATCLGEQRIVGFASDTVLLSRDGPTYVISDSAAPIRLDTGELLGAVLVFHDDSEQRRMSVELSYRATHDTLTGLSNRPEFEARLERLLERMDTEPGMHGVMYIDLDQFKLVNDACGHAVGDQLLRQIGNLLHEAVRGRDTVARLGGDEFGVILEHCDVEQAQRVGRKICDTMDEFRFTHDGQRFRVGTSIGIVALDARWTTVSAVLQAADSACYAAKEAGRNRVHVWFDTDSLIKERRGEVHWVNRIERAMDENHFVLYGQRIESIQGPQAGLHCEVLLRLHEADGSIVSPAVFMGAAERYHMAGRIDRWVVRRVFEALRAGTDPPEAIALMAINLSGQSIGDRTFHRDLVRMVHESGVDATRLCFEITETAAITNLVDAQLFIEDMRALGARVALDDFGAGAASFGYLKSLPVNFLKIDGQFVKDMLEDPLDNVAVRCFIDVARAVDVQTIAEFVERSDVCDALRALGADMAQGYLLHRPEPLQQLLRATAAPRTG